MIRKLSYFASLLLLLAACSVPYELSQQNMSYLYDYKADFTQPSYLLYHGQDSLSTLYYTFQWSDFQYTRQQEQQQYSARIRFTISLRLSYESKKPADSLVFYLTDSLYFGHNKINSDSVQLHIPADGEFVLEIKLKDMNREEEVNTYLPVYKTNRLDQQYFLARESGGSPLFSAYITAKQLITIKPPAGKRDRIWVRYYHRDFPIAIPPFAVDFGEPFDYKEDSLFSMELVQGVTPPFSLVKEGFYHFQADTAEKAGYTLFRFSENFPSVKTPEQALAPLRYILTVHEFEKLQNAPDYKLAIDSFWLDNSGNVNRAKSLISKYYNRVQDANLFFSSYLEGWKTDRGMVFIVFGPPNHVYRGTNTENWVYGEAGYSQSLRFNFIRVNNPFSYNDYSLFRNPFYKEAWYNTVENWRR